MVIFDVGSVVDVIDGKLYVIFGVGSVDGIMDVFVNIVGLNLMLGNLVDLMFSNGYVYVVEKLNGMILCFDNILNVVLGDIMFSFSIMYFVLELVNVLLVK